MDVKKQIEYWKTSGLEDFEAAKSLLEKGHYRQALFFAPAAIEKALKGHVSRVTTSACTPAGSAAAQKEPT